MSANPEMDRLDDRVTSIEKRTDSRINAIWAGIDSRRWAVDALAKRIADLEKRCALLERHYAPVPKNEVSFTLDSYLRLTHDPCAVCWHRLIDGDVEPCRGCECSRRDWTYGDPMPRNFELHEVLR